eukprot:CAMPEP_0113481232 /NCGR_PEP_ID=MMETSP0014_2-20120614/22303_1 /TAXON_ID=2857 /ORGANISM="Nitzschia sp." /LENGTH=179 /DNA_ID=CAMNT_0000374723 /DNA_START=91 /DNA_END=630 /DNA_ORIENTATION=+ /assembly_acc=CAM_ASM_000159
MTTFSTILLIIAVLALTSMSVTAFSPVAPRHMTSASASATASTATTTPATRLNMFGGAGAGTPTEDNPEEEDKMKQAAAAMGMPVEEYKLAMRAQKKLADDMDNTRVQGGAADNVLIDRDINNPPKDLKVTITEAAKAKGSTAVAEELIKALETAKDEAAKGRNEVRQSMMKMIQSGGL